jgi:hypothetical protein
VKAREGDARLPEALAAPGAILRLTMNLGEQECALQLESFLDRDASQEEYDHLARKMMVTAEKERARRLLPGYRRQLEQIEFVTGENKKKLAEINARLSEGKRQRELKITELRVHKDRAHTEAHDAWYGSGRKGEFKGTPQVHRMDTQINQLLEAQQKEEAEAAVQKAQLDTEIHDGDRRIVQAKVLLKEQEQLARGEDIAGVE